MERKTQISLQRKCAQLEGTLAGKVAEIGAMRDVIIRLQQELLQLKQREICAPKQAPMRRGNRFRTTATAVLAATRFERFVLDVDEADIQVSALGADGKQYVLDATEPHHSVFALKEKLAELSSIDTRNMELYLIHGPGRSLQDSETVEEIMRQLPQDCERHLELAIMVMEPVEWEILLRFRDAMGYAEWSRNKEGWGTLGVHQDPSRCAGITVDEATGKVVELDLCNTNLNGVMPSLAGCPALIDVYLSGNSLLTAASLQPFCHDPPPLLEQLDLDRCNLEEAPDFSNCGTLEVLNLKQNWLSPTGKARVEVQLPGCEGLYLDRW